MSFSLRLAFIFVLLINMFACFASAQAATKRLAFAFIDADDAKPPFLESILNAPDIDGLSVGLQWKSVEPEKGRFDWSKLDYIVREAAKRKRLVSISFIGSPKTPDWLANEKVQFFTSASLNRSIVVDPVPWDAAYLAFYKKFLAAAAVHLKQLNMTPYIFAVGVAAPSRSITLVNCRHNKMGSVAYDRNKYLAACTQMIDAYHLYFPTARQLVTAPQISMICAPDEDKAFFQELMNYALSKYGQSCWILVKDLRYDGSANIQSIQTYVGRTALGFQLAGVSKVSDDKGIGGSFPSNFQQAILYGIKSGALYFEIHGADAISDDPTVRAAIASIHH
ncbi:MAG: hypothetical protein P4L53_05995 [Candidatus Obscuribacterales bacterium]|nr:hypothetical protein [Candidatus Obscuribacterales bacterium]